MFYWKLLWKTIFLRHFLNYQIWLFCGNQTVFFKNLFDETILRFTIFTRSEKCLLASIVRTIHLHVVGFTDLSLVCLAFCFLLKIFLSLIWSSSLSMKFWPMLSSKGHWASDGSSLQCLTMPMPSIRMQCKMQFFLSLRLDFPVNKNIWHIGTSWLQKCMGLAQLLQYFDSIGQWTGSRLTEWLLISIHLHCTKIWIFQKCS